MSQHSDDSELLKSYFLGTASAAERAAVEDRYMGDADGAEELLLAEDELIDDYVCRALARGERELFEKNFLCTAERRRRLEFTRDLAESLTLVGAGETPAAPQRPRPRDEAAATPGRLSGALAPDYRREPFDILLDWLDPVRETAAEKYEAIRRRLIKLFTARGHVEAEDLADETINRVMRRVPDVSKGYVGDPAFYFYGVARMVLLEYEKGRGVLPVLPEFDTDARGLDDAELDDTEPARACLEMCLGQLSAADREMLLDYYRFEGKDKIASRKNLAERLGISLSALRLRTRRVRTHVAQCVTSCLEQAKGGN